jgi:hypothetical protein
MGPLIAFTDDGTAPIDDRSEHVKGESFDSKRI